MKVLQVINNLEPYGAETLFRDLVVGFDEVGIECDVYLLQSTGGHLESSLRSQETRIFCPSRASIYSLPHARFLARHLRSVFYDLVHVHLFPSQLWTALAARWARFGAPLITTEHSTHNRRRRAFFRPLDRWMYAQYRSIACISDATAQALTTWLPEVADRVRTCANGIHLETFAGAATEGKGELFSLPQECPVVLSVGRLERMKDQGTVIRALALVPGAHLVLAGSGPMLSELRGIAREAGVEDRVHFLGRRADVPALLKAADVFVQASLWEGFGIAALEAMASGLPVVATRVPGLSEIVGPAGRLFTPGDHRELASLLNEILKDQGIRVRLADAGKRRATHFSFENTVNCYRALYLNALASSASMSRPVTQNLN